MRQALALALRSGFSRIPVTGENLDDVVGITYLKDLVRRAQDAENVRNTTVAEVMRPAAYVPESKPVDALLREMQAARSHMAVVIDEYGGTAGLITIEDILEEIVGEITDEYDNERPPVERIDETARASRRGSPSRTSASCSTSSCPTATTSRRSAGCSPRRSAACPSPARRPSCTGCSSPPRTSAAGATASTPSSCTRVPDDDDERSESARDTTTPEGRPPKHDRRSIQRTRSW